MKHFTLLLILFLSLPAHPNEYQESVSVEMVQVYVTATDSDRRFITDLRLDDFIVRENGKVQQIMDFTNFSDPRSSNSEEIPPLTIAFSMDLSGSMSALSKNNTAKIELAKKAALSLLPELGPSDQMTVFGFHKLPKVIVPMTSNIQEIKQKIKSQRPQPQETALYDSLHIIVEQLNDHTGRKIVVVGSDGLDTSSHIKFETVVESLKTSDITLLAFGMDSLTLAPKENRFILNRLAEATGGYAFFPKTEDDLAQIMKDIRKIIRSQYSVWYTPQNEGDTANWRNIQITCKRPDVQIRYRKGYYSDAPNGQTSP
jgi:VWFA-related protein